MFAFTQMTGITLVFFWLIDPTDVTSQFTVHRFKVVPFGEMSSPFILNAALEHHLQQHDTAFSCDMNCMWTKLYLVRP